jgi:hypothetical protein
LASPCAVNALFSSNNRAAARQKILIWHAVAPLGWEYIGLTGDYVWSIADQPPAGTLRPLRQRQSLILVA